MPTPARKTDLQHRRNTRRTSAAADRLAQAARERPHVTDALRLIWREPLSRADIAEQLGLSRSTVSELVDQFLHAGLVAETGAVASRGGRRPIALSFQYDAFAILGVDMGAAHVGVALTNLRGNVLAWRERKHPVRTDPQGTRKLVLELAEQCLSELKGGARRLVGIGVAVPSPVDPRHPDRLSEVVMPAWHGEGIGRTLHDRFGVPVLIDNDANLGALAEYWWGGARGAQNLVYLKVATGVGSGHIVDGKIYRGATGMAGEIGHLALDPAGPACLCGLRGCLVTLVGTEALLSNAAALRARYPKTRLPKAATLTDLEDAALANDPLALKVVRDAAERLGIAVAGMLNLLNPSVVAVGGSLARLGEVLLEPLRTTVRSRTLMSPVNAATIMASELGARDVAVGAATQVLQAALEDPGTFPLDAAAR